MINVKYIQISVVNLKKTLECQSSIDSFHQARENNGQADDSLMEEDLNNDEIWTQQDREVVMACTGLVGSIR